MDNNMNTKFLTDKNISPENVVFRSATDSVFSLHGVYHDGTCFRRMPQEVADTASEEKNFQVKLFCRHTAGGRLRFKTNSPFIAIKAETSYIHNRGAMPLSCSAGFDYYVNGRFGGIFYPSVSLEKDFFGVTNFGNREEKLITLNFPGCNDLLSLSIGLDKDATVVPADDYTFTPYPVVFYGSSITQCGCASRPGMTYEAILSRALDMDYINLGFSGGARGEIGLAEYMAGLKMSAFVLDYDYNAPTPDHLRGTHKPFFDAIRAKNPTLPIIMLSRPTDRRTEEEYERRSIILETYRAAIESGDENVYFIDGMTLFEGIPDGDGTIDGVHPGDLSYANMARKIKPVLECAILKSRRNKQ